MRPRYVFTRGLLVERAACISILERTHTWDMKRSRYVLALIIGSFCILVGLFNMLRPEGNVLSGVFTGLGGLVIVITTYMVDRKTKAFKRSNIEP